MKDLALAIVVAAVWGHGLVALATPHPVDGATGAPPASHVAGCGTERWDVKTLTDPLASSVVLSPTPTDIATLGALKVSSPVKGDEARGVLEAEYQVYSVEGTVFVAKREEDQDIHIALEDGQGHTMIVESAYPPCARGSLVLAQIKAARAQVLALAGGKELTNATLKKLIGKHVRATGVFFADKLHGQSGVAPNGAELHPLLILEVLD